MNAAKQLKKEAKKLGWSLLRSNGSIKYGSLRAVTECHYQGRQKQALEPSKT